MKPTLNKHVWSLAGEEAVTYLLAVGKPVAVIRESGEVAACSLAREGRRRQSLALRLGRLETITKQKQLSLAGEEAVTYLLAGGKAAAVIRESGEVAACSLAREGRRRQSLALGLGRLETVSKQKQLPSVSLDSMRRAYAQKTT